MSLLVANEKGDIVNSDSQQLPGSRFWAPAINSPTKY